MSMFVHVTALNGTTGYNETTSQQSAGLELV